jgi:hypothetical protein
MRKRDGLLLIVALCTIIYVQISYEQPVDRVVRYDCTMAEMHPDYPVQVKEACRKMRAERKEND